MLIKVPIYTFLELSSLSENVHRDIWKTVYQIL